MIETWAYSRFRARQIFEGRPTWRYFRRDAITSERGHLPARGRWSVSLVSISFQTLAMLAILALLMKTLQLSIASMLKLFRNANLEDSPLFFSFSVTLILYSGFCPVTTRLYGVRQHSTKRTIQLTIHNKNESWYSCAQPWPLQLISKLASSLDRS